MNIPVLMLTCDRFEYAVKAIESLLKIRGASPYIIDDASTDARVKDYLTQTDFGTKRPRIYFGTERKGIAFRMNEFLRMTSGHELIAKIDSDTICKPDWLEKMLPFMRFADMIQSRHQIISATDPGGWESFTKNMIQKNGLLFHHFIGGSGILFKRNKVDQLPITEHKLMGWREFQRQHPELKKAFVPSVEIKLLDEHGYNDYPNYYKETGRL